MIDFETDQAKVLQKTENIRSLADQVERLENLNQEIEKKEKDLKQMKKDLEHISVEVIPTMMAEMGLSHLKLMDGSSVVNSFKLFLSLKISGPGENII